LQNEPDALHFIDEAYKHCKAIAAEAEGEDLLNKTAAGIKMKDKKDENHLSKGVLINRNPKAFINAIAQHRFWEREKPGKVPA